MKTASSIEEARRLVRDARAQGKRIGFVPTMGALHEGHGSLIDQAASECDYTAVSIFVNPLQFGPTEDLDRYPRPLEDDMEFCRRRGVDLVFVPEEKEMYPRPLQSFVEVEGLADGLCGARRPGHFRGVATVVAKLFHIVGPDRAYFGQKDAQQVAVIQRMVEDLNFPLEIRVVPTVRESDGLALSSRNRYLSSSQRQAALSLYRGLVSAQALFEAGERNAQTLIQRVRDALDQEEMVETEYVEAVDAVNLNPISYIDGPVLLAVAARVGTTRLIDNIVLTPE